MEKVGLENTSLNDNSYQIPVEENEGKSKTKSLVKGKLKEKQYKRRKGKGEDCQKSEKEIAKMKLKKDKTCSICSKVFRNVNLLNIHKRKHEKVTPFKCDICLTYFKKGDYLTKHKEMHTSYKCDLCIRYFADENKLTQHIQKRHNNTKRKKVINSKPSYNEIKVENEHEAIEPTEIQQSTSDPKENSSHTTKKRKRLSREVADENKQSKPAKKLRTKVSEIVNKENVSDRNEESQEKPQEKFQVRFNFLYFIYFVPMMCLLFNNVVEPRKEMTLKAKAYHKGWKHFSKVKNLDFHWHFCTYFFILFKYTFVPILQIHLCFFPGII